MAKTKKSYTSRGGGRNVNRKILNAVRRKRTPLQVLSNKIDAWKEGKRVMLTVANVNTNESNKPFIRKPASEVWGKYSRYVMKTNPTNKDSE
jgi:hypothetical protein